MYARPFALAIAATPYIARPSPRSRMCSRNCKQETRERERETPQGKGTVQWVPAMMLDLPDRMLHFRVIGTQFRDDIL